MGRLKLFFSFLRSRGTKNIVHPHPPLRGTFSLKGEGDYRKVDCFMKLQEGPAFGALIIGMGFAFFINQKTSNLPLALGAGVAIGVADYVFLIWIRRFTKK